MKIAVLATQFPDYSVEVASALSERSDVLLLADADHVARDSDANRRAALTRTRRLSLFRQRRKPHRVFACARVLYSALRYRPDVIIAHEHPHAHVAWMHKQLSRLAPVILIVHDPVAHAGRDGEFARRNSRWVAMERSSASAFLVHGAFCVDAVSAHARLRPVVSVPHGPILRPLRFPDALAPFRFLMFGRMEAYKGLDVLLEAARLLAARIGVAPIRVAGAGPELDRLHPEFSRIPGVAISRGFVPREAAIKEIACSSAVLLPYTEATQSGVISAAFASGKPVIASQVGGIPDFVDEGRNGLLVPPGDPEALAVAMERLMNDRDLATRLAEGARRSAQGEMSWRAYTDTVLAMAKQLAPSRRGGA